MSPPRPAEGPSPRRAFSRRIGASLAVLALAWAPFTRAAQGEGSPAASAEKPAPSAGEMLLVAGSGLTLRRLTPPDQDAVRPRLSPDGRRVAYVRRLPTSGPESGGKNEIWVLDLATGSTTRRVGVDDVGPHAGGTTSWSLHDLAWSPSGDRLAFTWYDGEGWARILLSDPGRPLVALPVPHGRDPWEKGATYLYSATQFVWDPGGGTGVLVAWDDACGSLYRIAVPPPGAEASSRPVPVPLPEGCRPLLVETPGWWVYRTRDDDFSQRLGIVDAHGSVEESHVFRTDAPVFARWGASPGPGRPPLAVWSTDKDLGVEAISVWMRDGLVEWHRESCHNDCPEPALVTDDGLYLFQPRADGGPLSLVTSPGAKPKRLVPSGVTALRADASGRAFLVARVDESGTSGLWSMKREPSSPPSGGKEAGSSPQPDGSTPP